MEDKKIITEKMVNACREYLREEEKAESTVRKYMADIRKLVLYADGREITKELLLNYKEDLKQNGYGVRSINSFLVSINVFFEFMGWYEFRVKTLRVQKEPFMPEEKELTKAEYTRLVQTAVRQGKKRLAMIITAVCTMGIRISELQFLTVFAVKKGVMEVENKGKIRKVMLTRELQKRLMGYIREEEIEDGVVFCTKSGKAVHRSNIWREMKMLCGDANVAEEKVFPHNLRHLFARTHYKLHKDIVRLADILGHASVETTRIYTKTSSSEYRKQLERMRLVIQC